MQLFTIINETAGSFVKYNPTGETYEIQDEDHSFLEEGSTTPGTLFHFYKSKFNTPS